MVRCLTYLLLLLLLVNLILALEWALEPGGRHGAHGLRGITSLSFSIIALHAIVTREVSLMWRSAFIRCLPREMLRDEHVSVHGRLLGHQLIRAVSVALSSILLDYGGIRDELIIIKSLSLVGALDGFIYVSLHTCGVIEVKMAISGSLSDSVLVVIASCWELRRCLEVCLR